MQVMMNDEESTSTATTNTTSTRCQPIDAAALHPITGLLRIKR
jgi:hypothetical protein